MIKNKYAVYIDGINLTPFVVFTPTIGNFLDERLDEITLTIKRCPIKTFTPLSPVELKITTEHSYGGMTVATYDRTLRFVVGNDSDAKENPVGKKLYDHTLSCYEPIKYAERVIADTLTFTNDIGRNYTGNARQVIPTLT